MSKQNWKMKQNKYYEKFNNKNIFNLKLIIIYLIKIILNRFYANCIKVDYADFKFEFSRKPDQNLATLFASSISSIAIFWQIL